MDKWRNDMKEYIKCPGCKRYTLKSKAKECKRCSTLYCKECIGFCRNHDKKLWLITMT
jgi:late competence protein required for DNA uptake (superfamily II DNA/RNA helicase)